MNIIKRDIAKKSLKKYKSDLFLEEQEVKTKQNREKLKKLENMFIKYSFP